MTDPRYMRRGLDFAVGKAVEEMGELSSALGKTLRFGWEGGNPELPPEKRETNAAWVRRELADVRGALDNLEREASAELGELYPHVDPSIAQMRKVLDLLGDQIAHVKQNAESIRDLLRGTSSDDMNNEARCRELAAMYLEELRLLYADWPQMPAGIQLDRRGDALRLARDALLSAYSTLEFRSHDELVRARVSEKVQAALKSVVAALGS